VRRWAPFRQGDLAALDVLLLEAANVVPMVDVFEGAHAPDVIGLRHDVDNVIEPAVRFAEWEADRGYRSTFYILHTAPCTGRTSGCCVSRATGSSSAATSSASTTTRSPKRPAPASRQRRCFTRRSPNSGRTATRSAAPSLTATRLVATLTATFGSSTTRCSPNAREATTGLPRAPVAGVNVVPVSLAAFGLEYDANWLPRGHYLSDSGGKWSQPFGDVAYGFPFDTQLHMLVHPDWWTEAFTTAQATV
jgi:hypothetical protein